MFIKNVFLKTDGTCVDIGAGLWNSSWEQYWSWRTGFTKKAEENGIYQKFKIEIGQENGVFDKA